ncbi:hypothetical protein AAFG07_31420 [Bradyrhizobium sp. B097]|uniref:hypothetical protein n=1 Tax=Bradyrhizobium sp. B097 TaxID=3140244 RepID=UPI0031836533
MSNILRRWESLLVPRRHREASSVDGGDHALASPEASSSENGTIPHSLDVIRIGLTTLGPEHRAGPQVDKVDAITSGASYRVQVVGAQLGCVVRQQSLNPVAGIWTRKDDGMPSLSVCHVSDLDWKAVSIGSEPLTY